MNKITLKEESKSLLDYVIIIISKVINTKVVNYGEVVEVIREIRYINNALMIIEYTEDL